MGAPMGNRNAAGKHGRSKEAKLVSKLARERRTGKIRGKKSRGKKVTWLPKQQLQRKRN